MRPNGTPPIRPPKAPNPILPAFISPSFAASSLRVARPSRRPQRLAFLLREVEGLETKETCKILEVTRTNLGVLLYRARNRLRACLERLGIEGST
jgi:hypothetical protein